MTPGLKIQLTRLDKAARAARAATNPAQRDAAQTFLVRKTTELRTRQHDLEIQLDAGYDFLRDHPYRPDHEANEDQCIDWLHTYERIEDALTAAAATWLDPDAVPKGGTT